MSCKGLYVNLVCLLYFIILSFLSSITFVAFQFCYTSAHQNSEKLSLGVVKVEPRVKTSILDHDNVVKFRCHFWIFKLAQVYLGVVQRHLHLPALAVPANASVLAKHLSSLLVFYGCNQENFIHLNLWLNQSIKQFLSLF